MTKFRGSESSDQEAGDAGDGRSDAAMNMAIEVATAATSIAAETAGVIIFEPRERNESGKQTRRSEAWLAPSHWRSRMERMIQQQAQELSQLH